MDKLLTIAIPTYNRAQKLDQQLAWLAKAINGFESECEILISDNCSSDDTQEIIKKWQLALTNITIKSKRNSQNIGVMRNFASCLQAATTKYVWAIADEDQIRDDAVGYVVNNLKQYPDLSLFLLNFSDYSSEYKEVMCERVFSSFNEKYYVDGQPIVEHYLATNYTGLGCMSATIYRTELVKKALNQWPSSVDNLEGQTYWTVLTGMSGGIKISQEIFFMYDSPMYFRTKPKLWFKTRYADLPEVYAKLIKVGCNRKVCRSLIIKHFAENNWKVIFGALRRWPILATSIVTSYLAMVSVSAWDYYFLLNSGRKR